MDKILEAASCIVLDRLRMNPFYALNLNKGICVWLRRGILWEQWWPHLSCVEKQTSTTTVFDKQKQKKYFFFVSFREKRFMWHLKLIFPQSSTEFSQRRWVTQQYSISLIIDPSNFLLKHQCWLSVSVSVLRRRTCCWREHFNTYLFCFRVSDRQTLEQILTPYIHPTESDPVTRQKWALSR